MYRLNITEFNEYADLPLTEFNKHKFSVYVVDKTWNYLFVNNFVAQNLGQRADNLAGKNMWDIFPELAKSPAFISIREKTENSLITNETVISPLTGQKINITGKPLRDCYLFCSSILPDKQELYNELRAELKKSK